jgi:hypothetical protein
MPITYVVLNGPPRSGKTTIARELVRTLAEKGAVTIGDSFAAPMKHFIATALGEKYKDIIDKDMPRAELRGYSVREFLIDLSESYIKPRYGSDAYGRWLAHRALRYSPLPEYVVCDDGGFASELDALDRFFLVQVSRPGVTFGNDSRSYIDDPHYVFDNNGHIDELWIKVRRLATAVEEYANTNP